MSWKWNGWKTNERTLHALLLESKHLSPKTFLHIGDRLQLPKCEGRDREKRNAKLQTEHLFYKRNRQIIQNTLFLRTWGAAILKCCQFIKIHFFQVFQLVSQLKKQLFIKMKTNWNSETEELRSSTIILWKWKFTNFN